jgi:hypothetical protein
VKLSELQIGEDYAANLTDKTRFEDATDQRRRWDDTPMLAGGFARYSRTRVTALAIGVPYGKTSQGVRIEYAYMAPDGVQMCPTCGHFTRGEEVERTVQVTVHASLLIAQWDDHLMEREMRRAGFDARIKAHRDRLLDEQIRDLLKGDS